MAAVTAGHRFLQAILPRGLFDALKAGTRTFMLECPCGHKRDLWEAGGAKGGGTEQRTLATCPVCDERSWHDKRKKSPEERRESILSARRVVVLLSAHAWWASVIAWGSAALIWATPLFLIEAVPDPIDLAIVYIVSFAAGWFGPYIWATTRYRVGRTELELCAGFITRTLELRKIEMVSRTRQGVGLSFAFDTDTLWIGYPSWFGGYLVSPREKELFLELLDLRCAQLEMRDGELLPVGGPAGPR
jgi:hypothetical protein